MLSQAARHWVRRVPRAIVCVATLIAFSFAPARAETAASDGQNAEASFSALIEFVQASGWRVNLQTVCGKLGVAHLTPECAFKQISVEAEAGRFFPHGFNVPVVPTGDVPYVLLFHLHPLVGEFLIVSPRAELISLHVRSKGSDYERVANELGQRVLEAELRFWTLNLDGVKALPKLERRDGR